MKTLVFLLLLALASAKIYQRCEWAKVLKNHGMDGYRGISLADCEYCGTSWDPALVFVVVILFYICGPQQLCKRMTTEESVLQSWQSATYPD